MKITHFNPPIHLQEDIAPDDDQSMAPYLHYYLHGEKIRWEELGDFGYRHTARYIVVGSGYKLFELLPTGSAHHAPRSFLAPNHRIPGVIIPGAFTEHKAAVNPLTVRARLDTGKRKSRANGGRMKDLADPPREANLA